MARAPRKQPEPQYTLTVKEICVIMRVNMRIGYELCHQQKFPVLRRGRVIRIPKDPFLKWWNSDAEKT